jgi:hypothetical protein
MYVGFTDSVNVIFFQSIHMCCALPSISYDVHGITRGHTNASVLHITELSRKRGMEVWSVHREAVQYKFLTASALPEDDPVWSKHVAPSVIVIVMF